MLTPIVAGVAVAECYIRIRRYYSCESLGNYSPEKIQSYILIETAIVTSNHFSKRRVL